MNKKKIILNVAAYLVVIVLGLGYLYVLYLGQHRNTSKMYELYYIDHSIAKWNGMDALDYTVGEKEVYKATNLSDDLSYMNRRSSQGMGVDMNGLFLATGDVSMYYMMNQTPDQDMDIKLYYSDPYENVSPGQESEAGAGEVQGQNGSNSDTGSTFANAEEKERPEISVYVNGEFLGKIDLNAKEYDDNGDSYTKFCISKEELNANDGCMRVEFVVDKPELLNDETGAYNGIYLTGMQMGGNI